MSATEKAVLFLPSTFLTGTAGPAKQNLRKTILMSHLKCRHLIAPFLLVLLSTNSYVFSQISVTGNVAPTFDGSDPWIIDGDLSVGLSGADAEITIASGSSVTNNRGSIGLSRNGTVTVVGENSLWSNASDLEVGRNGIGTLNVEAGATVQSGFGSEVGFGGAGAGRVTVTGVGSRWEATSILAGGSLLPSTINVEDGGSISADLSVFEAITVTIDGLGSSWNAGDFSLAGGVIDLQSQGTVQSQSTRVNGGGVVNVRGNSTSLNAADLTVGSFAEENVLNVESGGQLITGNSELGVQVRAEGTVNIDGAGSSWRNANELRLGRQEIESGLGGTGRIQVSNAGAIQSDRISIGFEAESEGFVTVTGPDSLLDVDDSIGVGVSGDGRITIEDGGQAVSRLATIGVNSGSQGIASVAGEGSRWDAESLNVGFSGRGTLTISDGGVVTSNLGRIGLAGGISGLNQGSVLVTGEGSLWQLDELLIGGATTTAPNPAQGFGSLRVEDNGRVDISGTLTLFSNGSLSVDGGTLEVGAIEIDDSILSPANFFLPLEAGLLSTGSVPGTLVQSGGVLAPGNSPGVTEIFGDYEFDAGTLSIELAGLTPVSEFDLVEVGGVAELAGNLEITFLDGFESLIQQTDTFTFLTATEGVTGILNGLVDGDTILTSDGLGTFTINYTSNAVTLSNFTSSIPEPTGVVFTSFAVLGVALTRRRR